MAKLNAKGVKIVGFDADDTLWINENYFREAEHEFCHLMMDYLEHEKTADELFRTETDNLDLFGYGAKGFTLSLIETAVRISGGKVTGEKIRQILDIGKKLIMQPIELLPGVTDTLQALQKKYKLVVVTKGDLLDQERKLKNSLLLPYFHHIEIMSNKHAADYKALISHLQIKPEEFVMVGNSLKSDILPVIKIGAQAVYVPYHTTWLHERLDEPPTPPYAQAQTIRDIVPLLL